MTDKNNPVLDSLKVSVRKNPWSAVIMILCIAGSVVTAILPPLVLERVINMITQGSEIPFKLAVFYLLMIVLADLFESAQGVSITVFGQKLTHELRTRLCEKLNRLPSEYYTANDSGTIASVFVNDADAIDSLYSNGIIGMVADAFKIISIMTIIFTMSRGLGIILLCTTPFLLLLTRVFQKNILRAQRDNRKAIARVNNHIPETIRNIRMIHVFQKESYMEDTYDEFISHSYNAINRSNVYDSIYSPIILVTQALIVAIMMIGASKGNDVGNIFGLNVGSAVAAISYVGKIFSPLESIGMEIQNIQSAVAGIKHIKEFLNEREKTAVEMTTVPESAVRDIRFDNVTFGYTPDVPVLKDCGFVIEPGNHATLMGRTGAGKSTIFRLLTGLYSPQHGTVSVAGINPVALAASDRRKLYGMVEQSYSVVPGNIRDQITLYDQEITDEMVYRALNLVNLLDTVLDMPNGLDTEMKDSLFSHGQMQLLSIARAVVTSPDILLLDEITANLDSTTEEKVISAIKKATEKRTVLSITHRYSDILQDERIIEVASCNTISKLND